MITDATHCRVIVLGLGWGGGPRVASGVERFVLFSFSALTNEVGGGAVVVVRVNHVA